MKTIKIFAAVVMAVALAGCLSSKCKDTGGEAKKSEMYQKERARRIEQIEKEQQEKKAKHKARIKNEIESKYDIKVVQLVIAFDLEVMTQGKVEIDDDGERKILTFRAQYDDEACIVELFE